ncbi:hypothetical protein LTS18_004153 [Coniosporium uncinatum]|uniref:Uncharacterized protein n=1 Tax=Coniosporium uncinatum TaxID=93489 RepID=A0ACC3D6D8_9PEZI|nr:hypothetical protein LTS18_004153 [Coniosporium uncinatum]
MTSDSPNMDRVLTTTELLEQILLQFPEGRILVKQRVNKYWKAVINGSVKLRRKVFLEPAVCGPVKFLRQGYSLGLFPRPQFFALFSDAQTEDQPSKELVLGKDFKVNPLLCDRQPINITSTVAMRIVHLDSSRLDLSFCDPSPDYATVDSSSTSCSSTYLTQPPITAMNLTVFRNKSRGVSYLINR